MSHQSFHASRSTSAEVACPAWQIRRPEEARCIGSCEPIKSLPTQTCHHQRLDRQRRAKVLRRICGIVEVRPMLIAKAASRTTEESTRCGTEVFLRIRRLNRLGVYPRECGSACRRSQCSGTVPCAVQGVLTGRRHPTVDPLTASQPGTPMPQDRRVSRQKFAAAPCV